MTQNRYGRPFRSTQDTSLCTPSRPPGLVATGTPDGTPARTDVAPYSRRIRIASAWLAGCKAAPRANGVHHHHQVRRAGDVLVPARGGLGVQHPSSQLVAGGAKRLHPSR